MFSISFKIYIPPLLLSFTKCSSIPNSSAPHNIPLDTSPLNLPFLIFIPPGNVELTLATGTISPSKTFLAPVHICTSSSSPTLT